jgi:PBP1b-binding outer membrane lipoprotein LpoB
MRVRVQFNEPDGKAETLDVVGPCIRLGRDAACQVAVAYVINRMPADLDTEHEAQSIARPVRNNAKFIKQADVLTRRYVSV